MDPYQCATVAIKLQPSEGNPTGIVIINESDFDPTTMTKVTLEPSVVVETPAEPEVPTTPPKVVAPWAAK